MLNSRPQEIMLQIFIIILFKTVIIRFYCVLVILNFFL